MSRPESLRRRGAARTRGVRLALLLLAAVAAQVGIWAAAAPHSFFTTFPGGGHSWVAVDGPYNEHLVRDVGALHLALLVLTLAAVRRPTAGLVRLTAAGWLAFSVPHLAYHAAHLDDLTGIDRLANAAALGGTVLLAALLLLGTLRMSPAADAAAPFRDSGVRGGAGVAGHREHRDRGGDGRRDQGWQGLDEPEAGPAG